MINISEELIYYKYLSEILPKGVCPEGYLLLYLFYERPPRVAPFNINEELIYSNYLRLNLKIEEQNLRKGFMHYPIGYLQKPFEYSMKRKTLEK